MLYAYSRYDTLGNVISAKDPNGNVSTVSYTDNFGDGSNPDTGSGGTYGATFALPALITSPAPNPGEPQHTAKSQYDFSTGLLTGFKDRNGIKTKTEYNDSFNRPTHVISANGVAAVETHARMYYAPTTQYGVTLSRNDVMTVKDQATVNDAVLRGWTVTDGFGRASESWTRHPQGDVKVTTLYDGLGRAKQTSNPYRVGDTPVYTTMTYDLAGRVTAVATPDGAALATAYDAAKVRVTDQAGKQRISETDGLGRLSKVWEVTSVGTDVVTFLGANSNSHLTAYGYDALDDLTAVTQGAQTRTFVYDSLKRLTSATNPESGTTSYVYDTNGNLLSKTDARTATTTLTYDALNRVKSKTYSGTTSEGINAANATTPVYFKYDSQAFNAGAPAGFNRGFATGRLAAMNYSGGSQGDYLGYDELGRSVRKTQQTGTLNYPITASYDRTGSMLNETYPSGRVVNYAYDTAGRANSATGTLGDGVARNYATGITYSAAGQMTLEQFGAATTLYHRQHFNNRLQLYDARVGTDSNPVNDGNSSSAWTMGSQDRGSTQLYYNTNYLIGNGGTNNNGNIWRMDTFVPLAADPWTGWAAAIDYYNYDALNRITQIIEQSYGSATQTPAVPMQQAYLYDRYGNRTIDANLTFGGAGNSTPYNYTVRQIPGRVEGEDYDFGGQGVAYNDTEATNFGGQYRTSEWVDIEANDGGYTIGYTNGGEWLKYTINVTTTGTYSLTTRLGSALSGATFHVEVDGVNKTGSLTVPNTGSWTVFTTIITPNISLSKGQHVMKVVFEGTGGGKGNFNWFDWALTAAGGTTTPTSAINNLVYAVNAANNRLVVPAGQSGVLEYDAAGNQTRDTFTQSGVARYSYDAENRLKTVQNDTLTITYATYTYDGDGKRVKRIASGVETWQVYGLGGELLAEYAASGAAGSPQKEYGYRNGQLLVTAAGGTVTWLMPDQLGSTRLEIGGTGAWNAVTRHDYLPFGEELGANVGVRGNVGSGYAVSAIRQRFTDKERDVETGLDYFIARYYSSVQGRFPSVDRLRASARITNPQTLNRYSYVLNRPTIAIDPDGLSTIIVTVTQHGNNNPTSSVRLVRTRGDSAGTNVGASHDNPGTYNGLAAGVGGRDRMVANSDTPFGAYNRRTVATRGGTANDRLGDAYGTGQVLMDPAAGEVVAARRNGILIHGGGSAVRARGGDPYADLQELFPTQGCVRLCNGHVNDLIQNINTLEGTADALDRMFIGTQEYLSDLAGQRDGNGAYRYPDLRIGLGLYSSNAELQQLVEEDQARRLREERGRAEEERQRRPQRLQ